MKRFVILAALLAAASLTLQAQQTGQAQKQEAKAPLNVAGKWTMTLDMSMGTATTALELKQDGEKVTGTYTGRYGTFPLEGTLKERSLVFSFNMSAEGTDVAMSFAGEVAADGQSMKGQATLGELGDATWSAKKDKTDSSGK